MAYRADNDLPGGDARRLGMAATRSPGTRARRAPRGLASLSAASLLIAGLLAGCGGTTPTASSSGVQPLEVSSPAVGRSGFLPATYTCSGKDIPPPLRWGNIPSSTTELALFLLDLSHTEAGPGGATQAKLRVAWVVRGLPPTLRGVTAGRLPTGAVTGHARYTICPPKGSTGEYMFRLYALPSRLQIPRTLSDLEAFKRINSSSTTAGDLISTYTRA
jgi:phosphatidylethanolamine-binding protein (PEBP) family uncharacterized protein